MNSFDELYKISISLTFLSFKIIEILIKKNSQEFLIGKTDVCNCSVTASFKEFKKIDGEFYKKIKEIIDSKIIY